MDEWFFGIFAMKILNSTFFNRIYIFSRFVLPLLTTDSSLVSLRRCSPLLPLLAQSYKKEVLLFGVVRISLYLCNQLKNKIAYKVKKYII